MFPAFFLDSLIPEDGTNRLSQITCNKLPTNVVWTPKTAQNSSNNTSEVCHQTCSEPCPLSITTAPPALSVWMKQPTFSLKSQNAPYVLFDIITRYKNAYWICWQQYTLLFCCLIKQCKCKWTFQPLKMKPLHCLKMSGTNYPVM